MKNTAEYQVYKLKGDERPDFAWLNVEESRKTLADGYLQSGQSARERIRDIANEAERRLKIKGFADKFFHYMARGYYSLSTPVWSNYGTNRGLGISCFSTHIEDSMESIIDAVAEIGMMSKGGGGTSIYCGEIRGRGSKITNNGKSNGSFSFLPMFEKTILSVSQGSSRRGQCAAYIDIDHSDIEEWLKIHTTGNEIQKMLYGVCISDQYIEKAHTDALKGDTRRMEVLLRVFRQRVEKGIPYIFFDDNVNKAKPDVYKDYNMEIHGSNMCAEIMLPKNAKESFVCCLASMNLYYFDEWKNTDAVETMIYFLDTVLSEFIEKTEGQKHLARARTFAMRHRALGLGALGWHSYLQSKMLPFDSAQAMMETKKIFSFIQEHALKASAEMAKKYGEPELLKGYGRRHTTVMAVAPTKSSSSILGGISEGIEPLRSNLFIKNLAKVKTTYRNPLFEILLEEKGKNTQEVWDSIALHDGSVQHLDFLTDEEKEVFKSFIEIDQFKLIKQAGLRQKYIDQGQSLNIFIPPEWNSRQIYDLHMYAHKEGIKSLYYANSLNEAQLKNREMLQKGLKNKVQKVEDVMEEGCESCGA